ncbi:MAG: glucose-1-phosphate cytidylyltransferase [Pseudomonadota bacterium]
MKVVILAGGFGTRLAEETDLRPKPLVEIGGKPILWHIMKIYEAAGHTDFIICCGYKGQMIKHYFVNYFMENYDITVDLAANSVEFRNEPTEKWKVTLVDTGADTMTGGRLKRVAHLVGKETFCLTYGDGVAALDINAVVEFHKKSAKVATITAVPSPGRFGAMSLSENGHVDSFQEKPANEMGMINGGFFVLEPKIFDYIKGDETVWERDPLEKLTAANELAAYQHHGFWRPMDTLRDKRELEDMWASGKAPWKVWP